MTDYDEIKFFMDNISTKKTNAIVTKKTNTIATNFTITASINFHSKKSKRLLYFAHSFISDHVTVDNYCYLLLCKTKRNNIKWKIKNFKKVRMKNRTCYY